uniref:complement C1s subcomponent-like n=1 Tax=Pristiophorus japonicus TaxID=55135 RepID=UPI00398E920C
LALFLLLLPPASSTISLRDLQGRFATPDYPQGYPNDVSQTWEIKVPSGYGIQLSFTYIDIEPSANCAYDNVQIQADEALYPPSCGSWTGDWKKFHFPREYHTSGNWMWVTFRSDFSNEERYTGFSAYYTAVDVNECEESNPCSHFCNNHIGGFLCTCRPGYVLQENQRLCGVRCSGEIFTRFKGLITSPNYPEHYAENSKCHYTIRIEQGFQIMLNFTSHFNIQRDAFGQCTADVLKYVLCPAKQCPVEILEHNVLQPKNSDYDYKDSVRVRCESGYELYVSSSHVNLFGERSRTLRANSISGNADKPSLFHLIGPMRCSGEIFTRFKGLITSPNYPEHYAENSKCHYTIRIEQGFQIMLNFTSHFNIQRDAFGQSKQCPVEILEHNVLQPKNSDYDYKDSVRVRCESGYELY